MSRDEKRVVIAETIIALRQRKAICSPYNILYHAMLENNCDNQEIVREMLFVVWYNTLVFEALATS